jgi:hypothetical protein
MLRRLVLALVLLVVAPVPGAKAQCSRIGEQVCQGGFLYTCQACGSEKCLIFSSEPCQVPVDSLAGTWSASSPCSIARAGSGTKPHSINQCAKRSGQRPPMQLI